MQELMSQVEKINQNLVEAEEKCVELSENEKQQDLEVREVQQEFGEAQAERLKLSKTINTEEATLERLRGKLHETLQKARVEEVDLPLISLTGDKSRASRSRRSDGQELSAADSSIGLSNALSQESTVSTHFSQSQDTRVQKDRRDASKVDFSGLSKELKQRLKSDREEKSYEISSSRRLLSLNLKSKAWCPI